MRNQFFTPRYVVEFLTDNTLGRIWYEMTQGQTMLVDSCRYLVRRPTEVFLRDPAQPIAGPPSTIWGEQAARGDFSALPEELDIAALSEFSLIIDGYELAERYGYGDCIDWADQQIAHYRATGEWPTSSLELWLILFRQQRYHGRASHEPEAAFYDEWRSAYRAFRQRLQQNELAQEELLRQPVYIPFRALKDPRTILMLDPACGSMHFGLYSFDLYERIYEEAWELEGEVGAQAFQRPAAMAPLRERYRDKASFLCDVPRLIIEHNIHGIDIDPRAVQIAGLSLWLRAQKSWQAQGVNPQERPTIRKSNIVCAEPMPGDKALLEEFLQGLRDDRLEALIRRVLNVPENQRVRATPTMADALCDLVRTVWEEMKLAGEAGSLLRIEESLIEAIAKGRAEWEEKMPLFRVETFRMTEEKPRVNYVKVVTGEEADFWSRAETLSLAALGDYAGQAEEGSYQRQLFAEDAARGFAFIDLCRKRYDVILMNPPFGIAPSNVLQMVRRSYPDYGNNLFVNFHTRAHQLLTANAFTGIISSRTFIFYREFEKFRETLMDSTPISCLADLGWEVLDNAQVETAAYVTLNTRNSLTAIGPFFRLQAVSLDQKYDLLLLAAKYDYKDNTFFVNRDLLNLLPGKPLCYWSSSAFIREIVDSPTLHPTVAYVGQGASPHSFFFRVWWEVMNLDINKRWKRVTRGGDFSPFYRSNPLVIDWYRNGRTVKEYILKQYPYLNGNYGWKIQDEDKYELLGITWGKRNERFNAQAMPAGHIFTDEGQGIILNNSKMALLILGYLNSTLVAYFLSLTSGLQKHYVYLRPVPILELSHTTCRNIEFATAQILALKQKWDSTSETSPLFLLPVPTNIGSLPTIATVYRVNVDNWTTDSEKIQNLRASIDGMIFTETALSIADITEIEGLAATLPPDTPNIEGFVPLNKDSLFELTLSFFSYYIGSALGRWDVRLAIGEKPTDEPLDPFVLLPISPPAMLRNNVGFPATPADIPVDYPLRISWSGILVDDPGHVEDINQRVREVLRVIWFDRADAIEQEACEILGVASLRAYFANPSHFFDNHLKRYSKSRRAAPIYWPLSTPSGSYTLWLYYHRLTDQTLYSCVNDFVEPKLKQVNDDVDTLRRRANRSRQEEKELARLSDLALELAAFRDELLRIARFWQPNLNDGVQITAAPLWRLFQHRAWQKRLKETWAALEAGDYGWAHLAYSIWPDRVRAKCKTDKSLAIAHDLEHLYVEPVKPVKVKKGGRKQQQLDDDEQGELL